MRVNYIKWFRNLVIVQPKGVTAVDKVTDTPNFAHSPYWVYMHFWAVVVYANTPTSYTHTQTDTYNTPNRLSHTINCPRWEAKKQFRIKATTDKARGAKNGAENSRRFIPNDTHMKIMRGEFSTQFARIHTRTHSLHNWNPKHRSKFGIGLEGGGGGGVGWFHLCCCCVPCVSPWQPWSDKAKNLIWPAGILALHVEMCEAITQKHNTDITKSRCILLTHPFHSNIPVDRLTPWVIQSNMQ